MYTKNDDGLLVETVERDPVVTTYTLEQLDAQLAYFQQQLGEIQTTISLIQAKKKAATDLGVVKKESDVSDVEEDILDI